MESLRSQKDGSPAGENLYLPRVAELIRVESLTEKEKLFEFEFVDGKDLGHAPGQFVEISQYGIGECPISVSSSPTKKKSFELVVRKAGNVTNALHELTSGTKVGIRGPYGRGFDTEVLRRKDIIFIGGGIGLVPLRSLINFVLDNPKQYGKVTILYGCREPKELLFDKEREKWEKDKSVNYRVTVDKSPQGSMWKGNIGVITTLIPDLKLDLTNTYAVVCGPPIMYKFVIKSLKEKGLADDKIYLSLERRMKCGVGKCGHCQIGPYYACKEGPVFRYDEIRDIKEAL